MQVENSLLVQTLACIPHLLTRSLSHMPAPACTERHLSVGVGSLCAAGVWGGIHLAALRALLTFTREDGLAASCWAVEIKEHSAHQLCELNGPHCLNDGEGCSIVVVMQILQTLFGCIVHCQGNGCA